MGELPLMSREAELSGILTRLTEPEPVAFVLAGEVGVGINQALTEGLVGNSPAYRPTAVGLCRSCPVRRRIRLPTPPRSCVIRNFSASAGYRGSFYLL